MRPRTVLTELPGVLALGGLLSCAAPEIALGAMVCGDARIAPAEGCDDGNHTSGDGCSSICAVEPGFVCDGWPSECWLPYCGDGIVTGSEECDDGGVVAGDGCDAGCELEVGWYVGGLTAPVPVCSPASESVGARLGNTLIPWPSVGALAPQAGFPAVARERDLHGPGTFAAFLGDGARTFDYDGDGDVDIFGVYGFGIGTGAGSFVFREVLQAQEFTLASALDTAPSRVVAGTGTWLGDAFLGDGNGLLECNGDPIGGFSCSTSPFVGWPTSPDGNFTTDLVVSDVDEDGVLEAVASLAGTRHPGETYSTAGPGSVLCELASPRSCVVLNAGGTFQSSVAVVDVDAQPGREILLGSSPAQNCAGGGCSDTLIRRGVEICTSAGCSEVTAVEAEQWAADHLFGDFDGDGDIDVIEFSNHVSLVQSWPDRLFVNDGVGAFSDAGDPFGPATASVHGYAGDVDNDGDLDVVRQVYDSATGQFPVHLCMNDGSALFSCGPALANDWFQSLYPDPTRTRLADFNGDGFLDIPTFTDLLLGDGNGNFTPSADMSWRRGVDADPGYSDFVTVDLVGLGDIPLTAPTTRFYARALPGVAGLPDDAEIQWYLHFDPERAPITIDAEGEFVTVPPTTYVALQLQILNGIGGSWMDQLQTAWVETFDLAGCEGGSDADGDGCDDLVDPNPAVADLDDADGDGLPDACDTCFDVDGDGVPPAGATVTDGCLAPTLQDADDADRFVCVPGTDDCDHCGIGWYHPRLSGDWDSDGLCGADDPDMDGDGCTDDIDWDPDWPSPDEDQDGLGSDCDDTDHPCVPYIGQEGCPNEPPTEPNYIEPPYSGASPALYTWDPPDVSQGMLVIIEHSIDEWHEPLTYEVQVAWVEEARDQPWWDQQLGWRSDPYPVSTIVDSATVGNSEGPVGDEEQTSVLFAADGFVVGEVYRLRMRAIDTLGATTDWAQSIFIADDGPEPETPSDDDDSAVEPPTTCSDCSQAGAEAPAAILLLPLVWGVQRRRRRA